MKFLFVLIFALQATSAFCQNDTIYSKKYPLKSMGELDKNDKEHGHWINYYLNDTIQSKGHYFHGVPDGLWQNFDSLGRKKNETTYDKGVKHGPSKEWDYNKKEYKTAIFSNNELNGKCIWIHFDGYKILEGEFLNGIKNGTWTWYYPNGGIKSQGEYVDGKEEGRHTWYHENGQIYAYADYKNGVVVKK